MMVGQLGVPLHHVEDVGDIAVLPPCAVCDGAETIRCTDPGCEPDDGDRHEHWIECPGCRLPVVGQVVAHVEKCPTCRGAGEVPHDRRYAECCDICGGSGWVRDQYVRVLEVLALFGWQDSHSLHDPHGCIQPDGTVDLWLHNGPLVRNVDLPGAVPGGVALIVEPADAPCRCGRPAEEHGDVTTDDPAVLGHEYEQNLHSVSAPSAPYTESPDERSQ